MTNTLYCSLDDKHRVMKISLDGNGTSEAVLVVGTGSPGSAADQLNNPWGTLVNRNQDR